MYLFITDVTFWILGVYHFVKLHKRLNKLFSYLPLYLSSSIIYSEIVNFIFPQSIIIKSLKDFKSTFEFLDKHITKVGFVHLNPEISTSFFLVILFKKFIKILETYFSNFLHCIWYEMNKVFTFQQRTIFLSWFFSKKLFYHFKMLKNLWDTQFMYSFGKTLLII